MTREQWEQKCIDAIDRVNFERWKAHYRSGIRATSAERYANMLAAMKAMKRIGRDNARARAEKLQRELEELESVIATDSELAAKVRESFRKSLDSEKWES